MVCVVWSREEVAVNLHDDDERWHDNVAIVREIWDQHGRILGTERVYRRHWRGRDALPQWGWTCESAKSVGFAHINEAQVWVDGAWSATQLARTQHLSADDMLLIAGVARDEQVAEFAHLFRR
jgi:hypothetical protein